MPHLIWLGRGGWTWYTGSSSWLFMAGLEAVLGIQKRGNILHIHPCVPKEWESYEVELSYQETKYHVKVFVDGASTSIKTIYFDNQVVQTNEIVMISDGKEHDVYVILGE